MKKLLIVSLLIISSAVSAGQLSARITQINPVSNDDVYALGGWEGVQISYQAKSGLYAFLADEDVDVYALGKAYSIKLQGFGVGVKHDIARGVNVFGQFGVFKLKNSHGKTRVFNEALFYYLNTRWAAVTNHTVYEWDTYEVETEDHTSALEVGIELNHPLGDSWAVGFAASYRGMKIKERLAGYRDVWPPGTHFEYGTSRDFSSFNTSLALIYAF